ncbi:MAG: hypothetical protein QOF24_2312 [Verrucomicrobiota bacterium]|jgi:hypothetical protein
MRTPADRLIAELNSKRFEKDLKRYAAEKAKKRAQRRKELLEKRIQTDVRLVAWIDILGFSQQLQAVQTDADLQAAYRKMLFVHEWLNKEAASDEPEVLAEANKIQGRTILALSDGIVVTGSLNAEVLGLYSPFDLLMSLVDQIILAQMACTMEGIFLRGGISIGPFHFDNDILLSPALVRAYKLESERATYPVILISPATVAALRRLPGIEAYAKNSEPSRDYFSPFKSPYQKRGERFCFLDYVRYMAAPDNYFFDSLADRDAATDRKRPAEERQRIFNDSHDKSALKGLQRHRDQLIKAYQKAESEGVRSKYRWLMRYHNRTLTNITSFYDDALVDLNEFKTPVSPSRVDHKRRGS